MEQHNYIIVLSGFDFYDVRVQKMLLFYDDDKTHALERTTGDSPNWGVPSSLVVKTFDTYPLPNRIELRWIALLEGRCFELSAVLDQKRAEELWKKQEQEYPEYPFRQYIVGIAPHGGVAIWLCNREKSILLHWMMAQEVQLNEIESLVIAPDTEMDYVVDSFLPLKKLKSHMRQFTYKYVPLEEYFNGERWVKYEVESKFYQEIELDGVEDKRLDGTYDYSDSNDMMRYHEAGKPRRITVKWHDKEASYLAHFWLDETIVVFFFDSFFNTFPDAQADLLLRIDTRADRYEIAMTGKNLPVRTLSYTQYIVMRDYVEISRSEYYTKKDGEWQWLS